MSIFRLRTVLSCTLPCLCVLLFGCNAWVAISSENLALEEVLQTNQFVCIQSDSPSRSRSVIPASFYDDGVCDCCDGSDEPSIECPNSCIDQVQKATVALQQELALLEDVLTARSESRHTHAQIHSKTLAELRELHAQYRKQYEALQSHSVSVSPHQRAYYLSVLPEHLRKLKQLVQFMRSHGTLYAPLYHGECLSKISDEKEYRGGTTSEDGVPETYLFTYCPFRYVTQIPISKIDQSTQEVLPGEKPTVLGRFSKLLQSDPSAPHVLYDGGDPCFGGPDRTVQVVYRCGPNMQLLRLRENGLCQYDLLVATPSACTSERVSVIKSILLSEDEPSSLDSSTASSWWQELASDVL
mmetsp:Transcript_26530/g.66751  ORF Transcript_26530/g.66751 Transcript_26530/m.66751 type:complete len:355 (+) Transcript_26530:1043-2107(+)|eukprot:CAMPEP_0174245158 /NCGR_PEP_ID=MMETSP0417-20130205/37857_1 /TAXON_ID=242541 /ORGANISM="Mayorella sp, Strain BSH-02190019" /LENGTH=354 /DNA_ID=CAMNT_0015324915 /DNA_START=131 /DNA_END=1195 /DNA_ORIENTATION=+